MAEKKRRKQNYVGAPKGNENAKGKGHGAGRQALFMGPASAGFAAGRAGLPKKALKRQTKVATAANAIGIGLGGAMQGAMIGVSANLAGSPISIKKSALIGAGVGATIGIAGGYGLNKVGQSLGKRSKRKWDKRNK